MQVFTYDNLELYDELLKGHISAEDAKSLKTVAIDGNTLKFYRVSEPVGDTEPAYSITLPSADLSGLIPKITGATDGNVAQTKADGTIKDSGVAVADLATKAEVEAVQDAVDAINDAESGILKTAKVYADTKVGELADGAVASNTSAIETLNGDETTVGSVKKQIKDSVDPINTKIGDTSALTTTEKSTIVGAVNELKSEIGDVQSAGAVTIDTSVTTEGMSKSYTFKQNGVTLGIVDVPKDMVLQSGVVEKDPEGQPEGTYLVLTLANATNDKVYINVGTLVDIYTAEQSASQIQLTINPATREISAVVVAGSIGTTELADNSIVTSKIADGNVTKAKLHADVQDSLGKADSAVQSVISGTANGTIAVDGTDVAVTGLGSAAYTNADAYDAAGVAEEKVNALANGAVATNTSNIATLQGLVGEGFEPISESFIRGLFA